MEALDKVIVLVAVCDGYLARAFFDHYIVYEDEHERAKRQVSIEVAVFMVELDGLYNEMLLCVCLLLVLTQRIGFDVDTCDEMGQVSCSGALDQRHLFEDESTKTYQSHVGWVLFLRSSTHSFLI